MCADSNASWESLVAGDGWAYCVLSADWVKFFLGLQSVAGYLGLALDFVVRRLGRGLIAIFRDFFASAGEIFILAGGWALAHHLWGLDTFLMFPNLLGS